MKRYSSATKLTNKKSYLEYMADEKSKRSSSISFLSGFTRNMATKHIDIVRNEDELTSIFNKIQSQLDRLTSVHF
jgi:hypothetical protein